MTVIIKFMAILLVIAGIAANAIYCYLMGKERGYEEGLRDAGKTTNKMEVTNDPTE